MFKKAVTGLLAGFVLALSATHASASTVETFDTEAAMDALVDRDVFAGDFNTQWWASTGDLTGLVFFNSYNSTNSISLKDDSLSILSFDFAEHTHETSTGNTWTWSFFDSLGSLLGTLDYNQTGDSSVQSLDLVALGFSNVNTVQLSHPFGWLGIDNLEYGDANLSPVPVPAAAWLFGSALLGFAGWSRRKNKAA